MARAILTHRASVPPPAADDPYLWYAALDLNLIPWHVGAGGWGVQFPLTAPAAPVTTRQVTVHTSGNFTTEAAVDGTEVTIGTGWAQTVNVTVAGDNVDVIVPSGVTVGRIQVNGSGVRVRGSTVGSHSGGLMGQYRSLVGATDLIVDGVDLNGAANDGASERNQAFRVTAERVAVVNCRAIAPGYIWLGDAEQCVIAGCSFYHGAATRSDAGFVEGWGVRNSSGPITIFDSQIAGTRYVNVRTHSRGNPGELLHIAQCDLMALAEGRAVWGWDNLNNPPLGNGQGMILEDSRIYGYCEPGCGFIQEVQADNCNYSRVRRNEFYSGGTVDYDQAYLDAEEAAGGTAGANEGDGGPGDHDWSDSNTFAALTAFPAWGGPGDPTAIALPGGLTLITGEGACPSIP